MFGNRMIIASYLVASCLTALVSLTKYAFSPYNCWTGLRCGPKIPFCELGDFVLIYFIEFFIWLKIIIIIFSFNIQSDTLQDVYK